jgi:hypothetical protein
VGFLEIPSHSEVRYRTHDLHPLLPLTGSYRRIQALFCTDTEAVLSKHAIPTLAGKRSCEKTSPSIVISLVEGVDSRNLILQRPDGMGISIPLFMQV